MSGTYPTWVEQLNDAMKSGGCTRLVDPAPWGGGVALALAPHPDDPDAIAVTLKLLADSGWTVHWAIVTSGWSGVQDEYCRPDPVAKGQARMREQCESARLFGLDPHRLYFLHTGEDDEGQLAPTWVNQRAVTSLLEGLSPDLVLLPHRHDTNATHRLVYEWFAEWAQGWARPVLAMGNEDPKTQDFEPNAQVIFGEEQAQWKASLLECHRTQSARNQKTRGITFAERILGVNRCPDGTYAERFHAERWRI